MTLRSRFLLAPLAALAVGLSGCAPASEPEPGDSPDAEGHGRIEGAVETSEPQLGLLTIDPEGVVRHLDLLDESLAELGAVPSPARVASDGRYVLAADETGVWIIDSGRWTWDHVDHFHYYRAEPRLLGSVAGSGVATLATTLSSTTGGTGLFFPDSGEAVLLDTAALSRGELVERFRVAVGAHDGLAVPIGEFALVTKPQAGAAASVAVYDAEGAPVPGAEAECMDASGTASTRVGAVIGCRDGALLATIAEGVVQLDRIPYPPDASAPAATAFSGREGRPTIAGLAGDAGVWLLDTRERSWTLLPSPAPLTAVTAVDDEAGHVVALASDGRVLVLEGRSGSVLAATTSLVADPAGVDGSPAALIADQHRAYLNAPAERRLFEIDFADGGRIARVFETATPPAFFAGTGR